MTNSADISALLERARKRLEDGRSEDALDLCRQVIASAPDCSEAFYEIGRIELQAGHVAQAQAHFEKAAQLEPERALYAQYLGITSGLAGNLQDSARHFRRVVTLEPENSSAHMNLGKALGQQGQLTAAADCYRKAAQLSPLNAEASLELGNALRRLGDLPAAVNAYETALSVRPSFIRVNLPLAATLLDAGRIDEATALLERLTTEYPNGAELFDYLGQARMASGDFSAAIDSYGQAMRINPELARSGNNLGHARLAAWQPAAAIERFRATLKLKPDYARAHSNLLLTMNYLPDVAPESLYEEAKRFGRQHDRDEHVAGPAQNRPVDARIRLGYLSPDFRSHSVAHFTARLINEHDRNRFEVFLYSAVTKPDQITATFEQQCDHWRPIAHLSDQAAAELIRQDDLDILVDLAGHTANNRLPVFGYKPAPIQVTWLGYPNTTGMDSMDYRLTDAIADPPGETDALHSETLLRLESGFLCYQTGNPQPQVTAAPALESGTITFGSFNHLPKLNARVIRLWARILNRVPGARLMLKSRSFMNGDVRMACTRIFTEQGVTPERLLLRQMTSSRHAHLAMYGEIDIALDTFPYNGTTTTCEALWMGVPVIALAGERHAGRVGASILSHSGCAEFIAGDEEAYVELACALAADTGRLNDLRQTLRQRLLASDLMNLPGFARALENLFTRIRRTDSAN